MASIGINKQPFHLVDPSPWPFFGAVTAWTMTIGGVGYFHGVETGGITLFGGFLMLLLTMYIWWRDVVREATYEGHHTYVTQAGLRIGIILFIVSEVIFFFAFFWAFFSSSIAPVIDIGMQWPPLGIEYLSAWEVPFLNTIILLLSGASVTWAHHAIIAENKEQLVNGLLVTIVLAAAFTACQVFEYIDSSYNISDSVYGSSFFIATGFHGFHVFIGTIALVVCFFRALKGHFTSEHHIGLESAIWYWHFVDVVWLFLFTAVYWWGGI